MGDAFSAQKLLGAQHGVTDNHVIRKKNRGVCKNIEFLPKIRIVC
jgi:hypothetical protein